MIRVRWESMYVNVSVMIFVILMWISWNVWRVRLILRCWRHVGLGVRDRCWIVVISCRSVELFAPNGDRKLFEKHVNWRKCHFMTFLNERSYRMWMVKLKVRLFASKICWLQDILLYCWDQNNIQYQTIMVIFTFRNMLHLFFMKIISTWKK